MTEILNEKYQNLVDADIRNYVENNVLPIYDSEKVDGGHKRPHIEYVVNRSMKFATNFSKTTGTAIDYNMVYVIAACHDTGLTFADRKVHEQASGVYVKGNKDLLRFFTKEQIDIIAEAVSQHRASLEGEPNTIYGKIVSQADRDINLDTILMRTYEFRRYKEPFAHNYSLMRKDIIDHLKDKYTTSGYGAKKHWFEDEDYDNFILEVNKLVTSTIAFDKRFAKANNLNLRFLTTEIA